MNLTCKILTLGVIIGLSACSNPTGQNLTQKMQQTGIGQKMNSPEALAFREKISDGFGDIVYEAGEAYTTVEQKFQIARFPAMQPVIVRHGTMIANDAQEIEANKDRWNARKKQHYVVELANGEAFRFSQPAGPQFHTNQMATLLRNGLSVTLIK